MWIALVTVYGIFKGIRDITKKKAMQINSTMEVLFFYTLLSFILCAALSFAGDGGKTPLETDFSKLWIIAVKSSVIFVAWICSFKAIERLPIGFYGIMDMSRVVIAAILSVVFLHETPTEAKIAGMAIVIAGLLLVNVRKEGNGRKAEALSIALVLVSCLMNAVSENLDKYLMGSTELSSGQLQFWYMFFLVVLYFGYLVVSRTSIDWKKLFKNYWIVIMSVLFVFGDKALFEACKYENSSVITMTLIKQCSVLITIVGGRLVFKEKHTLYKLACAVIIIAGIVTSVAV